MSIFIFILFTIYFCSEIRYCFHFVGVESITVLAGLHSGSEIGDMLESLHTDARRIKFGRFHQFASSGLQKDDFEDCLDSLFTLRENYEDSYLI